MFCFLFIFIFIFILFLFFMLAFVIPSLLLFAHSPRTPHPPTHPCPVQEQYYAFVCGLILHNVIRFSFYSQDPTFFSTAWVIAGMVLSWVTAVLVAIEHREVSRRLLGRTTRCVRVYFVLFFCFGWLVCATACFQKVIAW